MLGLFDGFEVPGLVQLPLWRPDGPAPTERDAPTSVLGGVVELNGTRVRFTLRPSRAADRRTTALADQSTTTKYNTQAAPGPQCDPRPPSG